jgi:hypothetical protein
MTSTSGTSTCTRRFAGGLSTSSSSTAVERVWPSEFEWLAECFTAPWLRPRRAECRALSLGGRSDRARTVAAAGDAHETRSEFE